jgi:hypothetical protein
MKTVIDYLLYTISQIMEQRMQDPSVSDLKIILVALAPLSGWGLSHAEINQYLQTFTLLAGLLVPTIVFGYKWIKSLFNKSGKDKE